MKRIMYVLDDGKRSFTYARIAGFCDAIKKSDEPIDMHIFRSAGFAEYDPLHNCGEYNIYKLPVFNDFDGIFLDINNTYLTSRNIYGARGASYVIRSAAACNKPVVAIANRIGDFYFVGIDNNAAMTDMIEYLHKDLKLTDFWFIMGPVDNYESSIRLDALVNYCSVHSLPHEESRIYSESYAMECGEHGFEKLYESFSGKLPQAIICANDPIASGVIRAASRAGRKIPEECYITGFDNLDMSAVMSPSLTTIDQFRWDMGGKCIDLMQRIWRGEEVPKTLYLPTRVVIRESTGSKKPSSEMLIERVAADLDNEINTEAFNSQLCSAQYSLPGCESIEEMCGALEGCLSLTECSGFSLVINKKLHDYGKQIEIDQDTGRIRSAGSGLTIEGYPDTMELLYTWDRDKGSSYPKKMIDGLFPCFESERGGNDYLYVPLHFMETTVGFVVIKGCVEILYRQKIAPIVNTLTMAMRSFFAGRELESINHMLSGISMRDNLTGLYNRLGYHHLASELFDKIQDENKSLGVIFIDMDKMKYFNDTFGHACGDDAIKSVAGAIEKSIPEDAIPVRFGGDEFIILMRADNEEEIRQLIEQILRAVPGEAKKRKMPEAPGISSGFVLTDPKSRLSLNDYVEEADKLMYNNKKLHRAGYMQKDGIDNM
ncbi:MAG: GGDEF domain-containing protein [Lachnospiraceae bacterium]|nr:GGDEF domain-containing protein [Lachnospiraceae bacterium]